MQNDNKVNDTAGVGLTNYNNSQNDGFDFRYLVAKVAGNWQWFALSLILCVGLGVLYILYGIPTFTITARVLVNGRNANKISSGVNETSILNELGLFSQENDINNEMLQLNSRTLLEKAIHDLQYNVSYWAQTPIRFAESYTKSPFYIDLIDLKGGLDNPLAWDVRIDGDKVKFMDDYTDDKFTLTWGDTAKLKFCTFVLVKNPNSPEVKDPNFPMGLKIAPFAATYYAISESILTFLSAENTTSMDITFDASVPEKGEDFINHLIDLYVQTKINSNNAIADSTIEFINDRIAGVARELSNVEGGIQSFQKSNNITDIQEQGKFLIGQSSDAIKAAAALQAKIIWIDGLENNLADETDFQRTLPTTSPIDDQAYIALVEKYNTLQQQRQAMLLTTTENNPQVQGIDAQLKQIRSNLLKTLRTYKDGLLVSQNNLQSQSTSVQAAIQKMPSQQRQYLEATRRQDVMQQLYVYLLTVREQTAVSKSDDIAPIRVVDAAKAGVYPYWPNKIIVIIAAIFLGILIPSVTILINELNNNKVTTREDITSATTAPLIAEISESKSKNPIVVSRELRTAVAEQFRTLRTNLLFKLEGTGNKVIMCTSTSSGEGKSFVTLNLAVAMALSGKKVLLVDMELRKAQISSDLGLENNVGIADYLEKGEVFKNVIMPSGIDENLWVLSSGSLTANPSEALLNDKMKTLFEEMRSKFDFIIIDTPPAAVVTDAQIVGMYADITLYIVRQKFTFKKHVDLIEDLKLNGKLKNISVILNDVKLVPGYNLGYGFGYRLDEDNGYYHSESVETKKSLLQKIFPPREA